MTATPENTNGWRPMTSASAGMIPSLQVPLQADAQAGRGQYLTYDASGNVGLNDGTVPGLVSAGVAYPEVRSDLSSIAGEARTIAWWGWGVAQKQSTIVNDFFTAADIAVPFFIADANTIGKKSNDSGDNRALGGLVFGLHGSGTDAAAVIWSGPVAQLLARSALATAFFSLASFAIADALASTAIAERTIPHAQLHGTVTSIVFNGAAVPADNTDYAIITIAKRDGAGGGAVTLGTYDTRITGNGAITVFVDAPFTLSVVAGALNLLETDIITITTTKGGAGQVLTGAIMVNGKVI